MASGGEQVITIIQMCLYQHRAKMIEWSKAVLRQGLSWPRFRGTSLVGRDCGHGMGSHLIRSHFYWHTPGDLVLRDSAS